MKNQLEALVNEMHDSGILYSEAVREFKKTFIANVLARSGGNQCKAARELGMHRNTLRRTISELKVNLNEARGMTRPMGSARPAEAPMAMEKNAAR